MRAKTLSSLAVLTAVIFVSCFSSARTADVPGGGSAALNGTVTSQEEGAMEGVLVTAKRTGATVAYTVVSDAQGRYRFPASRLEAGHYAISIRAVGYDLEGPAAADVSAQKPATLDLKLRKTSNLAAQLTNTEWIESVPGTPQQKAAFSNCVLCHTVQRVVRSSHTADEFMQLLPRMANYTNQSTPLHPQPRIAQRLAVQSEQQGGEDALDRRKQAQQQLADFLATINLSSTDHWNYALKTLPRPKGEATRVFITEYDLPEKTREPHDVIVDSHGTVWYDSFGEEILGKLDANTGKVTEYPAPLLQPQAPTGSLGLRFDEQENPWLGMMFQGAVAKFDKNTGKFQVFRLPAEDYKPYTQLTEISPEHHDVDGKAWGVDAGTYSVLRLDIASGKFEWFHPFSQPSPNIYDVIPDAENNAYFTVLGEDKIGRIDAKSGKISFFTTPTPKSGPRRGSMDAQGRLWFGEARVNRIGMFDTKSERFQEWVVPTPYSNPYDVMVDKEGNAWTASMYSDRVVRLNSKTGQMVEYLLPRSTNIRRIWVDDASNSVWVGSNHGASIVRVEPLE